MTRVADWFPELPPLAITSGIKAISQTCGMDVLASTIAVTAAVKKRMVSHTPRFHVMVIKAVSRYPSFNGATAALIWASSVASSRTVSSTSS